MVFFVVTALIGQWIYKTNDIEQYGGIDSFLIQSKLFAFVETFSVSIVC